MSKSKKLTWPDNWIEELQDACAVRGVYLNNACFPIMMRILRTFPKRAQDAITKHYKEGKTYVEMSYEIPYKSDLNNIMKTKRISVEAVRQLVVRTNKRMVDALVEELKT